MNLFENSPLVTNKEISVDHLINGSSQLLTFTLVSGKEGLQRKISEQNLHRPGLALAGFVDLFAFNRVQLFGNTEVHYLAKLPKDECRASLERFFQFEIPCIIFTNNLQPSEDFIELSNKHNIPVLISSLSTTKATYLIHDFLDDQFSVSMAVHASFVDVYGVGILFTGKSGIGKSEVALDLIERGHRLVSDDLTIITRKGANLLMGASDAVNKHFMEIRGIGIINIEKMFGIRAVRFQKRLEVIVNLETWDAKKHYERLGDHDKTVSVLDVQIPFVELPIVPGKNITVITEIIALHYLLKHYGYNPVKALQERLQKRMDNNIQFDRQVQYFEHDFE